MWVGVVSVGESVCITRKSVCVCWNGNIESIIIHPFLSPFKYTHTHACTHACAVLGRG